MVLQFSQLWQPLDRFDMLLHTHYQPPALLNSPGWAEVASFFFFCMRMSFGLAILFKKWFASNHRQTWAQIHRRADILKSSMWLAKSFEASSLGWETLQPAYFSLVTSGPISRNNPSMFCLLQKAAVDPQSWNHSAHPEHKQVNFIMQVVMQAAVAGKGCAHLALIYPQFYICFSFG